MEIRNSYEHPFDDLRGKKECTTDDIIKGVDLMETEDRRRFYEWVAKAALVRHLTKSKAVQNMDPISGQDECEVIEDGAEETAEGIMYIMQVKGSLWRVILERDEMCRKAIEQNPTLINSPALFIMDLREATCDCMNDRIKPQQLH